MMANQWRTRTRHYKLNSVQIGMLLREQEKKTIICCSKWLLVQFGSFGCLDSHECVQQFECFFFKYCFLEEAVMNMYTTWVYAWEGNDRTTEREKERERKRTERKSVCVCVWERGRESNPVVVQSQLARGPCLFMQGTAMHGRNETAPNHSQSPRPHIHSAEKSTLRPTTIFWKKKANPCFSCEGFGRDTTTFPKQCHRSHCTPELCLLFKPLALEIFFLYYSTLCHICVGVVFAPKVRP